MSTGPVNEQSRVVFVDLARVVAIFAMIQGHTIDALLDTGYRTSAVFQAWTFVRGLTSCGFFFLAGFAFVLSTFRHGHRLPVTCRPAIRRLARFATFLLVGYGLRLPSARVLYLTSASGESWRAFFAIDALHCVAVTLAGLQLLAMATRSRARFLTGALTGCLAVVVLTPLVWHTNWEPLLGRALAAYLSGESGSLFPLFPWSAYGLLGAVAGAAYLGARDAVAFPARVMITGGFTMLAAAAVGAMAPWTTLDADFWSTSPNQFLLRAGLVVIVVAMLAVASTRVRRLPPVLNAIAQESLLVYVVHLCIVYGSAWNSGLRAWHQSLALGPAIGCVLLLWTSMAALAWGWHHCKRQRPHMAHWIVNAALVGGAALMI